MRSIATICIVFLLLIFSNVARSQDLLRLKNLSTFNIDLLTNQDLLKINQQLSQQNLTLDQIRPLLLSRGMSQVDFTSLKLKLASAQKSSSSPNARYRFNEKQSELLKQQQKTLMLSKEDPQIEMMNELDSLEMESHLKESKPLIDPKIYGAELFNQQNEYSTLNTKTAIPNTEALTSAASTMATPVNYILGAGDVVNLVVYGQQQSEEQLKVTREGNLNISNVGFVKVGGLTIEAAEVKLKTAMQKAYPTIASGKSFINITLGEIRNIHVTIIGANNPGTYLVPSLYSVYAAVHKAGGPTNMGSFRKIELIRNSKLIKTLDLYKLMQEGDQNNNITLKDNDIIRIPSYTTRVELSGQLKRPGLFEVLPNESFEQILKFAGGFTDTAYTANLKVIRKGDKEREVLDLSSKEFTSFKPQSGDFFLVSKILDRYKNRVKVEGAVFRPDIYEWKPQMTVSDLIAKADGPREDAYLPRAIIIRQQEDLTKQMIPVDLGKAIKKISPHDIPLMNEDELMISSIIDLKDSLKVSLQGEVRIPGEYHFIDGMTLKSLLLQAGGFTDASSGRIEVAHLILRDTILGNDTRTSEVINFLLVDSLSVSKLDIPLKPYDVVTVYKKPLYQKLETVLVVGQVNAPGPYALKDSRERVSDLILRVGGLLPDANPDGVYLKRFKSEEERKKIADEAKRLQALLADSSSVILQDIQKEYDRIPLNLSEIMKNPGSPVDVILKSRDELIVPKFESQVRVSGAVFQSTQIPFEVGRAFPYYVSSAGGATRDAIKKSAYIVYANGKTSTTKSFLGIKKYPKVFPGSEIIVPKETSQKIKITTGELIGISSAIASLAGVVIALLRIL